MRVCTCSGRASAAARPAPSQGPAIMPGGSREAYDARRGRSDGHRRQERRGPCCAYMGAGGAGHFVKMVHNGIEYAIMQLIGEAYALLGTAGGLSAPEQARGVRRTGTGASSTRTSSRSRPPCSAKVDDETGRPLVDVILDTAGQKGTGKWTSQTASDLGVAVPSIDAALHGRMLSALKRERVAAAAILGRGERAGGAGSRAARRP